MSDLIRDQLQEAEEARKDVDKYIGEHKSRSAWLATAARTFGMLVFVALKALVDKATKREQDK